MLPGLVLLQHLTENNPYVTDDRDVDPFVLPYLSRIDVDMDDIRIRRKCLHLPGDPVVKANTNCNQQVTFGYRIVGRFRTVHSQHSQAKLMIAWNRPQAHQRRRHGDLPYFGKSYQFIRPP